MRASAALRERLAMHSARCSHRPSDGLSRDAAGRSIDRIAFLHAILQNEDGGSVAQRWSGCLQGAPNPAYSQYRLWCAATSRHIESENLCLTSRRADTIGWVGASMLAPPFYTS